MESSVVRSPSRWPAVAVMGFAAYGCCSLMFAAGSYALAGAMLGQALLYFAVAAALARRASWAGWFAVGIATSGLVVDAIFLAAWSFDTGSILDTAGQAGLLWLALLARDHVAAYPSRDGLTGTASAPIGWTFALAAGVLPPAVMGALMPTFDGCRMLSWAGHQPGDLAALTVLAVGGLYLVARLRTLGLLVLAASSVVGSFGVTRAAQESWALRHVTTERSELFVLLQIDPHPALHPGAFMAIIAFGFAVAALVPLGPHFLRALFRK